jgi:phospholipid/cholesterol/gamma-HCH transport system substrate-binding protein
MKIKFKIRKEVKTGLLVIVSLGVLYWGLNFLKGIDIFNKNTVYYAVYNKVEGLTVSNPVQINGFTVGSVRAINFMDDNSGRLIVTIELREMEFRLPKYTVSRIASTDLLGSKSIKLLLGNEIDDFHEEGDTLRSSVEASLSEEVNRQILPLKAKAEELLSSLDTLVGVVQAILNKEARENLSASFASIKNALATFELVALRTDTMISSEKARIAQIMINFESISANLKDNNENVTRILENIALISDSIAQSDITATINNAGVAFESAAEIMDKVNRGEGTLGQLVNNDSLYFHLESAARDLDLLLIDLEKHPNRYVQVSVFGKKDKDKKQEDKEKKKREKEESKKE